MARGGRFLEAPVIGTKGPAREGSLVILASGDDTLYQDCYSCFAAMGKKTFYLGNSQHTKIFFFFFKECYMIIYLDPLEIKEKCYMLSWVFRKIN